MGTSELDAGGNPVMEWHLIQGWVEILLVASCFGNCNKLRSNRPHRLCADLTNLLVYLYEQ